MFSAIEHLSTRPKPKEVRVVVNPAPSRKIPLLAILNQAFRDAGIHWDIDITHGDGDARVRIKTLNGSIDLRGN